MAYNPSLYMPQYYQPQPSWAYNQQAITAQPINGLVSVTGIEGAKAYQLPPNSSMPLFDGNNDIMYVKTTDSAGYPTIKTFKFEPVEPAEAKPDKADYVPRSEFDALVVQVRELLGNAESAKAAVDDGK